MIVEQSKQVIEEVNKAFIGKNDIIEKVLMTIYAGGHVLLEDCPGVGKTTLALAFSKVLGLSSKRITGRQINLHIGKEQLIASFFWQTRLTVLLRKHRRHFWKSWRNIRLR